MAPHRQHLKVCTALACAALLLSFITASAQADSTQVDKRKLTTLVAAGTVAYAGSMIILSNEWYKQYQRESFHFFNDANEWKQMDKVGHFYSAFQISLVASRSLQGCNVPKKKSDIIGAITSFGVMSSIEVLDGFSSGYGASAPDLVANALGSTFYLGQNLLWKEERLYPKYSFHRTNFAPQRPDVLGSGLSEEFLKDYNGQTYWISADMDKFMKFPKWLNIAVGYGIEEMIYAQVQPNLALSYDPYRQFYLSLDFDLTAIPVKSKFLRGLITVVNMIKLPSPSIEFSKKGTRFYAFYF